VEGRATRGLVNAGFTGNPGLVRALARSAECGHVTNCSECGHVFTQGVRTQCPGGFGIPSQGETFGYCTCLEIEAAGRAGHWMHGYESKQSFTMVHALIC